jgi:hypothetical protein
VRRAVSVVFAVALALPGAARAEDYDLESPSWNGLATFAADADEAGCTVSTPASLDWSTLGAHDVLWFIYPEVSVDGGRLKRHLASGGRALVADDFGAAASALSALEIRHEKGPLPATVPRYRDNPHLPIAHSTLATELGRSAGEIVANHPARFETALPATFGFGEGEALVVEGQVGTGYFVALSDPSVLINNMLELEGNREFARALARRLCRPGDRILAFTHSFQMKGDPADDEGSPFQRFNQALGGVNGALHDGAGGGRALGLAAVALAVIALFVFAGAFPARDSVGGDWLRFERLLQREEPALLLPSGLPWDYSLPSGVVRDEAVDRLSAALGVSVERMGPSELGRRVESLVNGDAGADAGRRAAELWRELHRLGWKPGERPVESISARRFRRMHELATSLFAALETRHNRGG